MTKLKPTDSIMERPHRRLNLLTGEYVLVSPQRATRPWSGQQEKPEPATQPDYDPHCYLCPGNNRAEGAVNPSYDSTYVFTNDYSALLPGEGVKKIVSDELLVAEPEGGLCRVVCYSPNHNLTIARMHTDMVVSIIETWQREFKEIGSLPEINHVQIFENRGLVMGCSNPHPHGQIWASQSLPTIPSQEHQRQQVFWKEKKRCLLCTYLARELAEQERIVMENDSFVALVPFWAVWPFEILLLPRQHASSIISLRESQKKDFAEILIRLGVCYDNLFTTSFPYSMGIHQQPTDDKTHDHWHWHVHFLPPLLRSRSVKKHMVGFELLAMPQRDLSAESAAEKLRLLSKIHYLERMV